jgi:hypothetical protein
MNKQYSFSLPSRLATSKLARLLQKLCYLFIWTVIILAFVVGVMVLISDIFLSTLPHAPISAAPLLLIGAAYLSFQAFIRPKPLDLFKALIVSSAFILWGIDQLLAAGWLATTIGDIVITLYVIDLGWIMIDRLKQRNSVTKNA